MKIINPPYNAANVIVVGGTIDDTVIGGTTPTAGSFTTLKQTTGAAAGAIPISDAAGALTLTAATGSGAPVSATSPTLVTPALGTPQSGDLQNCDLSVPPAIGGTTPAPGTFTSLIANAPAKVESFTGTISAATRTATFAETADYDLCKVGSTLIADGDTRIVVAIGASPTVTVDAATSWSGVAVTSLQDPISQEKDADGTVVSYVNALGGMGLVGGTGLQKGVVYGDGDTGFFENSDNLIGVSLNAGSYYYFSTNGFYGAGGASLRTSAPTTTNPSFVPTNADTNTGIGHAAADQLSLISGGVEGIRLSEETNKMSEKFGNSSLGGVGRVAFTAVGTATAAKTFDIEVNIPSGAKIIGVQLRVDVALTSSDGGTAWSAAYIDGSTQSVASATALAKNTKVNTPFANTDTDIASAETDITVTCDDSKTFVAGGQVRAIVYYQEFTAMGDAS